MGKVRQIKGIMNVNQILESQSPIPTVYTKFILPVSWAIAGSRGIDKPQTQTTPK